MILEQLGFSDWFSEKHQKELSDSLHIARVISVFRDQYRISGEYGELSAEVTGKLMYNSDSSSDYPVVGDWVYVQYFDNHTMAIIHRVFPRKTVIKRKTPGKTVDFQLIAANIDGAFLIQSLDQNYNLARLERYLVMTNETGIIPYILLSKRDLIDNKQLDQIKKEIERRTGIPTVYPFSNLSKVGIKEIHPLLIPRKTYCLLGSSGVGKSSLLNSLFGDDRLKTQAVRAADSRGRHTTSGRQMYFLENGAMLIDTPGMRELGNFDIGQGLNETFNEIEAMAKDCKFSDCTHEHETDCAILRAVEDGSISRERYQNFIKMRKEAAYYEMSYREKRDRDKRFGKMVKNVIKNNKRKY